jgi:ubiquinone/menaquinone biosynthesis C-methylase UbiE
MVSLKNWDNKTWLSSKDYIKSFCKFLIKNSNLNFKSEILDIGCGRGKISGNLYSELKLISKPFGIDIVDHKDKDKRIKFKKSNGLNFLDKNKKFFDLILIKQTIHLLKIREIKKLIKLCKKYLKPNGVIMVLTLDPYKNEIPTFKLMHNELQNSLNRDKKIITILKKDNKKTKIKKFIYKVEISKKKYLQMIHDRYISTLLDFDLKQIKNGLNEIDNKYNKKLNFKDQLICLIIKNN